MSLQRPAVIVAACACAASAGIHVALVPEHLRGSEALAAAFVLAAVALVAAVAALVARPAEPAVAALAALLLAGLIGCWAAVATSGIPVLAPRPEPIDAVAVATKLIEAVGLGGAIWLSQPPGGRRSPTISGGTR